MEAPMRHALVIVCLSSLVLWGCGGGVPALPGQELKASCVNGTGILSETDEQAYLQIGGAFDQLRHDEGPGNPPVKMTTRIDQFVKQYMCENNIPGIGIGIVWQGNLVYVKGYGLARGWGTPSQLDDVPVRGQRTRFRWASVSKTVTGIASVIATQELDGGGQPVYDLDAPLQSNYRCGTEFCVYGYPDTYYPTWVDEMEDDDWPIDVEPVPAVEDLYDITPRRLLANRGGVGHYADLDPALGSTTPGEADKAMNPGFIWALSYWTDKPLVKLPGPSYVYSSFGFNMAGAALDQAVPGETYWSFVKSRIADMALPSPMIYFHPDDTNDPVYDGAPWWTTMDRAHGYRRNDQGDILLNTTPGDVSYKLPSGGYISTVADMALYANGLLNNHFLDAAGSEECWTPQANRVLGIEPPPSSGYGLGFSIGSQSGERLVAHNGAQQDTKTRMMLWPDGEDPTVGKLGIVVMSNAEYCDPLTVSNGIEALLRNPYVQNGAIVFNGTTPRNLEWAAEDADQRFASENGPYVDDGVYLDPQLDLYGAPLFEEQTAHQYNPRYDRDKAPEPSPDPEGEDRDPREPPLPGVVVYSDLNR
jgi:CubicO group peptidase (beta-lactamase class C family)